MVDKSRALAMMLSSARSWESNRSSISGRAREVRPCHPSLTWRGLAGKALFEPATIATVGRSDALSNVTASRKPGLDSLPFRFQPGRDSNDCMAGFGNFTLLR